MLNLPASFSTSDAPQHNHRHTDPDYDNLTPVQAQARFREFIRNFRRGPLFPYREQPRARYHKGENQLDIDLGDLNKYDLLLQNFLQSNPRDFIAHFERAAGCPKNGNCWAGRG